MNNIDIKHDGNMIEEAAKVLLQIIEKDRLELSDSLYQSIHYQATKIDNYATSLNSKLKTT